MTESSIHDPLTIRRLYGRQQGHSLRPKQAELVETLLPQLEITTEQAVSATDLFGDDRPLEFEIGFGKGEHLAGQAMMRPDHGFIGCEPFLDGVVGLLTHIDNNQIKNIRLHRGDALDILEQLPDNCLDRAYLLHPDPWPKARHAKRRFMNHGPIGLIARKMKKGGEFRFGTDHPIYCRWAMMIMGQRPDFEWLAQTPRDFLQRPEDWPQTRYEKKAREKGHEVWYFRYRRV
ncbi:tRNA (guanine(46)-N(7))-methyltransferase TrmB [Zymomonas sp.]|uniref:tRNA (guanine(46)-N(7))-methyltransferase TrmB n=1 Tax=Zymomonas sp. TaxID=2068624 RepID=UPI0025DEB481|nr:tRNA (guanine(46)-N(7))-methyltransferase TrmB [Zymomonas sp.]MCA1955433.1 tRNA (guanine(46)-N(7))-methyltransferase TrmB [Zymomonas sp.]